ncbi:hypothetical protein GCM10009740_15950 [Terrabacter terrae]|uniref:Uncharacterized protein n=1 Tax=Terrabacter terrae TaxID=318434 RepID=A0ABN2U3I3_9MICO
MLDKTGTVTTGQMGVVAIHTTAGVDTADVLNIAGSLEDASEHPIARGRRPRHDQRIPPQQA